MGYGYISVFRKLALGFEEIEKGFQNLKRSFSEQEEGHRKVEELVENIMHKNMEIYEQMKFSNIKDIKQAFTEFASQIFSALQVRSLTLIFPFRSTTLQ